MTNTELDIDAERASFESAMNAARFFPAELCFARTKSPSGRDEYANSHLESCWTGWLARATIQPTAAEPVAWMCPKDPDVASAFKWAVKGVDYSGLSCGCGEKHVAVAPVAPADAVRDAERLDWLEQMGNEPEGLLLHAGRGKVCARGLGLSNLNRTLREAVDTAMRPTTPKEPAQ